MSFIEIYFNSALRNTVEIENNSASIGRAGYNPIQIDNKGVSLLHAVITRQDKEWFIEDLNSTNGTYLNGVKVLGKQKIKFGDTISICKHDLKFAGERSRSEQAAPIYQSDDSDRTIMLGNNPAGTGVSNTSNCYLLVHGEKRNINKLLLNKLSYTIGNGKASDIRLGGWFTPKLVAEISRIGNNYYLFPRKSSLIKLNGRDLTTQAKLNNDDSIIIKKLLLKFVQE
ncbi:FHA domain-containing protein [Methylomonas rivi]|uniref:FHA domain-containing protein n=1 Tax=Methylomonas rivi TaxID=2952226 RepID=A0ABT1U6E7_9GAMM|nr:FHA domain-containing protein [Methylomonas sp. WSC-6]MBS4052085.1 FHA domain-containing protein [Methylomonas sp.]MCQ8129206.1 FHA domain-containing protein [Methylomonas sp. WSC-6]